MKPSFLLMCSILLLVCPPAHAQFSYETNNGTVTITGYTGNDGYVVIPSAINYLPVVAIGYEAFVGSIITSLTIPNSVTSIGKEAFAGSSLTFVVIPDSVTNIEDGAFGFCDSLQAIDVNVNNDVFVSVDGVLFDKSEKTLIQFPAGNGAGSYAVPDGVTTIRGEAFSSCYSLGNVALPDTLISIGDWAFSDVPLAEVTIPNSVTSIGDGTFAEGSFFTITVPNGVTNIGAQAFFSVNLRSINVDPANGFYSSLDGILFDKDKTSLIQVPVGAGLGSYTIPDTVTSIGDWAFQFCSSLTNIIIPTSVTNIAEGVFWNCHSLKSVAIPNSVIHLGAGAFLFTSLTEITIPNRIASIENDTFAASGLTSVSIPNGVTNIGDGAFADCPLTNVVLPNNLISIGDVAFSSTSLRSITIPSRVTSIGDGPFSYCTNLTAILVDPLNSVYSSVEGVLFNRTSLIQYPVGNRSANYRIPNSITGIRDSAFRGCRFLISVTIPGGVTSIEAAAFVDCGNLTKIYFQGNAPRADLRGPEFEFPATVFYLPGTTGWGTSYGGVPTGVWTLPYPLILNNTPGSGAQSNGFGFTISWATNASVIVEASTDLNNPNWSPVQTNALNNGVVNFIDPGWANYPSRFYRVLSQ